MGRPMPTLVIMVKYPAFARVKTRLARDIGPVAATRWYRSHLRALLRALPVNWRIELHLTPTNRLRDMHRLLCRWGVGHIPVTLQPRGDLGAKMRHGLGRPYKGALLLIGSDILDVTPRLLMEIAGRARGGAMQIGPAPDGGYWLLGRTRRRQFPRRFLRDIAWSAPTTRADSCASWNWVDWQVAPIRNDVDGAVDLP